MKAIAPISLSVHSLLVLLLLFLSGANALGPGLFYFVQEWPGSSCNTKRGCCYPTPGKPASDFIIREFYPFDFDGSVPKCGGSYFNASKITGLLRQLQVKWPKLSCPSSSNALKFWAYEWNKHSTCQGYFLDENTYFKRALSLRKQMNLLQILKDAGIQPNDGFYSTFQINDAIQKATGFMPGIRCNRDKDGKSQLFRIYQCASPGDPKFQDCLGIPTFKCGSKIKFPSF